MINKFFHEYGSQKAAWIHEQEIVNESSKKLKVLSKNEEILRNRILRTFLKRDRKTHELTTYNFDPSTFKQYLMIYDAVLPSIITQNNNGDFVLVFETDNQLAAFEEAFSNGLEIKGTMVYFKKVGYNDLGTALQSVKSLLNRKKKEKKLRKKAFIMTLFPRNVDDKITCGGLLQPKHPCYIRLNEIFHTDWYKQSIKKFRLKPEPLDGDNNEMMKQYYNHFESLNSDIWRWYHAHIPHSKYMDKVHGFIKEYVLTTIHKTLNLPNVAATNLDNMLTVFGSLSYGLFINKYSDVDIGVNLQIIERSSNNNKKKSLSKNNNNKKVKFLQLLCSKIKNNNTQIFAKIQKNKRKCNGEQVKYNGKKQKKTTQNKHAKYHKKMKKLESKLYKRKEKRDVVIRDERYEARVPIIKLYVAPLKITMDISINNGGNSVSKLIMMYVKYDIRIRPFLCCIKYWVHQRSICNAYKGYLNTFGWLLLGIKFLQNGLDIPILPLMRMDTKSGSVMINKQNMNTEQSNKDTVSELLSSFFEYYANFDFNKYQISIANNTKYELKDIDRFNVKPHQTVWMIQHPLMKDINVSSSVRKWTSHLMKQQLAIASDMILQSNWNELTKKISDKTQTMHADPQYTCSCLLLRNLRYDVNEQHIKQFVSRIAKPISVVMSRYKSGRHIGKCYVAFKSPQIAHNVMAELNGNLLLGRPVIMYFAPLESIDDDDDDDNDDGDGDIKLKPITFTRKIKLIGAKQTKHQNDKSHRKKSKKQPKNNDNTTIDSAMSYNGLLLD